MIMNKSGTYGVYWSLEHRIGRSRCPVLVSPNTTKGDSFWESLTTCKQCKMAMMSIRTMMANVELTYSPSRGLHL